MQLEFVRIVDVHPESHSVDVVIMKDGRRISGVQVLSAHGGGDFGSYGFGIPTETGYDAKTTQKRDVFAAMSWVGREPVIIGFFFPQLSSILFEEKERSISREPSDLYRTVDSKANLEIYHPSGAYVRIATDPKHEDLSGKDYRASWKIKNNTDQRVHIHAEQAGGIAYVDIDEDGNIVVHGPVLYVDTPKSIFTGNMTVDGSLHVVGEIGSEADVVAGDGQVSLLEHKHDQVHIGEEISGGPIGGAGMPTKDDFTPDGDLS